MNNNPFKELTLDILLTWKCNLSCNKCCLPQTGPEVSFNDFTKNLDKLYDIGIRKIILTGGEPLVRKDIIEIILYAKKKGFEIYISTNGILLREKWKNICHCISWISLSLDCPTAELNEKITGKGGILHFNQRIPRSLLRGSSSC